MEKWLKGLLSAIIGGAANAITVMVVDPTNFNLNEGLAKLGTVALVSAIVAAAMYLKQSPLPGAGAKTANMSGRVRMPALVVLALICAIAVAAGAVMTGCGARQTATQQIAEQTQGMDQVQRAGYVAKAMLHDAEGIYNASAKSYLRNEQILGRVSPESKAKLKKLVQDMKTMLDQWRGLEPMAAVAAMEAKDDSFQDMRRQVINELARHLLE